MIGAWLQFFRLPNLPVAPGDALAGAAITAICLGNGAPSAAKMAGAAFSALFLYMYGLADNDVVGAATDAVSAPERPIPSGRISLRAARVARACCWGAGLLTGALAGLSPAWWLAAGLLLAAIVTYNRLKRAWLMGTCRALSVLAGAAAVVPPPIGWTFSPYRPAACLAVGWLLYIAAVTKLSEGEDAPSEGLGNRRYLFGLSSWTPLAACVFLPDPRLALLPLAGAFFAFVAWCAAVGPLWQAHGPAERRAAVGRTVGALLYLQVGFMLAYPAPVFLTGACTVWIAARLVRRFAPHVSGS